MTKEEMITHACKICNVKDYRRLSSVDYQLRKLNKERNEIQKRIRRTNKYAKKYGG